MGVLYDNLLLDPTKERVYLLLAEPYDPATSAVKTVRYSQGTSVPMFDGQHWPARIKVAFNYETAVSENGLPVQGANTSFGEVRIATGDSTSDVLRTYAWDGRRVRIYLGADGFAFTDFGLIFDGTADDVWWNRNDFIISLRPYSEVLRKPVQNTLYLGTGQLEGGIDLKGSPKPLAFGAPKNVPPVQLDATYHVFQYSAGPTGSVVGAYDRSKDIAAVSNLTDVYAWTPVVAGKTVTDVADGIVRYGAKPDGPVTVDVTGFTVAGAVVSTAADIAKTLVSNFGGYATIDTAGLATLNTDQPAALSLYIPNSPQNISDILDRIAETIHGYWGFTPTGAFTMGRIQIGTPVMTLNDADIEGIERLKTPRPHWRVRVGYAPSWLVQATDDSTLCAADARKQFAAQEFRFVVAEDATVKTRRLLAEDREVTTLFDTETAAQAEATRQLNLLKTDHNSYRVTITNKQFLLKAGQTITLNCSELGITAKNFLIERIAENTGDSSTELTLWA